MKLAVFPGFGASDGTSKPYRLFAFDDTGIVQSMTEEEPDAFYDRIGICLKEWSLTEILVVESLALEPMYIRDMCEGLSCDVKDVRCNYRFKGKRDEEIVLML